MPIQPKGLAIKQECTASDEAAGVQVGPKDGCIKNATGQHGKPERAAKAEIERAFNAGRQRSTVLDAGSESKAAGCYERGAGGVKETHEIAGEYKERSTQTSTKEVAGQRAGSASKNKSSADTEQDLQHKWEYIE